MTETERTNRMAKNAGKGTAWGKPVILKSLRNYLVANVCALLPMLWVGLGWMPDQVKVFWRGEDESPVAIMCDGLVLQGEDYGRWEEGRVWRYYLRAGMDWQDLAFRLPEEKGAENVGRIELQKWKLLRWGKAGSGLTPMSGVKNCWKFENPRFERMGFASWKMVVCLVLLELLLLGLSGMFAIRHQEDAWKELLPSVLGVAFALALLLQVALPVQIYVSNQSAFPCTPKELGLTVALRFAVAWGLGGLTLGLLSRCFGRWILTLVLAFAFCVDLESSVLAIGLPQLNGNWKYFENTTRAVWDTAIWMAIFAFMCGMHSVLKKHLGKVALGLAILVITALLLDVHPEPKADSSKWIVNELCPKGGVAQSVSYAKARNVFVFVIDSLECAQAHAIMDDSVAGPELRQKFRGFTEYTDNVGTGDYSLVAVANLLTGKYPESAENIVEYYDSILTVDSVLKDYLDEGYAIYFMEGDAKSFTNRRKTLPQEEKGSILGRRARDGFGWTLPEINRFRWFPFGAKLRYLRLWSLSSPSGREEYIREWRLYPRLAHARINPEEKGVFMFVHTEGVHVPVIFNRHGEQMPEADDSDAGCVEMGIYIMQHLGNLFDNYRQQGIYDDALILVLADHGRHDVFGRFSQGDFTRLPGTARPFLWCKAPNSQHDFASTSLPTSHAKIAELLRRASQAILSEKEVQSILQSKSRLYRRWYLFDKQKEDWIVDADGKLVVQGGATNAKSGCKGLEPLVVGSPYDLSIDNIEKLLQHFLLENIKCEMKYLDFFPEHSAMSMSFKVPDKGKKYVLNLRMSQVYYPAPNETGSYMIIGHHGNAQAQQILGEEYGMHDIRLSGLVPDGEGVIKFFVKRENGFHSLVRFIRIQVDEE